jgi:hypothetical protein
LIQFKDEQDANQMKELEKAQAAGTNSSDQKVAGDKNQ